jgi:hypothetical protein
MAAAVKTPKTARAGIVPLGSLPGGGLSPVRLAEDPSPNCPYPERGFFTYTETHWRPDNTGHEQLNGTALTRDRVELGRTLVFRYQYIEKYREVDTIDQAYLTALAKDLTTARAAGVKLILRFAYSSSGMDSPYHSDAPVVRVLSHIAQLAPVLNAGADVIFALQMGFVGTWGEGYYTDNFCSDPNRPWLLNSTDWANRRSVLDALLRSLDARIFILLRYPGWRDHLYPSPSAHPDLRRLGFHNDGFLAPDDDYGTYTTHTRLSAVDARAYVAHETALHTVPNGGESAAANPPTSDWANAMGEMRVRRFVYLNPLYHSDVLRSWGANLDIAKMLLGYRLVAEEVRSQATVARNNKLRVELDLRNYGFAHPSNPRPMRFLLDNPAGRRVDFGVSPDVRTLAPGSGYTLWAELPIPAWYPKGPCRLGLWLPDQDPTLVSRPEYSMRLANVGTWNEVDGYNNLRQVVVT